MPVSAMATQFDGAISFAGNVVLDNSDLDLATQFTMFDNVVVTAVEGAYSGIATNAPPPFVIYTPFVFRPLSVPPPLVNLWSFSWGVNTIYSFDATSMEIPFSNTNNIVVEGEGLARITGFDPSPGYWTITANSAGSTFSFSGGSTATAVPEPATLLLFGCGLIGVAVVKRK